MDHLAELTAEMATDHKAKIEQEETIHDRMRKVHELKSRNSSLSADGIKDWLIATTSDEKQNILKSKIYQNKEKTSSAFGKSLSNLLLDADDDTQDSAKIVQANGGSSKILPTVVENDDNNSEMDLETGEHSSEKRFYRSFKARYDH